jgi:hypothetical protein
MLSNDNTLKSLGVEKGNENDSEGAGEGLGTRNRFLHSAALSHLDQGLSNCGMRTTSGTPANTCLVIKIK